MAPLHRPGTAVGTNATIALASITGRGHPTAEWAATYHTLRNTIEGMNGIAKDGAYAALGHPSRRRIRGIAAQSVFTALLFTGTNINAILSFLRQVLPDAAGTLRKPRRRRRTTPPVSTWAPVVATRGGAPPP